MSVRQVPVCEVTIRVNDCFAGLRAKLLGTPASWAEYNIRIVDLGEDMTLHLANGRNHPDEAGHRLAADILLQTVLAAVGAPETPPG